MQEEGVELPTDEPDVLTPLPPPPPPQSSSGDQQKEDNTSITPSAMSLQSALENRDTLFAMPQLQVCDVLTTCIEGIEVIKLARRNTYYYIIYIR